MFAQTVEEDKIDLILGLEQYSIDNKTKTGTKTINKFLENMTGNADDEDMIEVGEQMLENMGGKKVGTETVLGKQCDVWEISSMGTKIWVWNGIALKTTIDFLGQSYSIIATNIQVDVTVPANKLKIPKGFTITEMQNIPGMEGLFGN